MRAGDAAGASGDEVRSMSARPTVTRPYAKVSRPFDEAQGKPEHEDCSVTSSGPIARFALALTAWTERWIPDAFIFALLATFIVFAAALGATPATITQVVDAWGRGFWDLIPFTLQMALVIITGHVLATSSPIGRVIRVLAAVPS